MEQQQFEKTPAKANRWFKAFIVLALLYGITFSLDAFFNWVFFFGAAYSLFLSYYYLPMQPKIFQGRPKASRFDQQQQAGNPNTWTAKKIIQLIAYTIGGLFVLLFIIGIFSDDDQPVDTDASESAVTLTGTGNDFVNKGENDSADYYYTRALEIDPNYLEAVYGKGLVLYNRGEKDEANKNFLQAYEGGYRYPWLSWVLADANDKAGNTDKAIELYKESVNLDSSYVDSYRRLAELVPAERDLYLQLADKYSSN